MTPRTVGTYAGWLTLAAALLAAPAYAVAPITEAEFAGSLTSLSANVAQTLAAQKAAVAEAAADAQQAQEAQFPDGYAWNTSVAVTAVSPGASVLSSRVSPDSSYTPGHLCTPTDPNFKEYRYAEHIPYCNRNVTQQMKTEISAHYGVLQSAWNNYEFDHLIPLAIGGDSSIDNLWPQPHAPVTQQHQCPL